MSVTECRTQTTPNRVRCFGKGALIEEVAKEKWDLIKVVCTQPFNKSLKYGLSFVKFHTPASEEKDESVLPVVPVFNSSNPFKFKIREKSPESDNETSASLFARWKQDKSQSNARNGSPLSSKKRFFSFIHYF